MKSPVKKIKKRQIKDLEKIYTNHVCDKGHLSKIYKKLPKLKSKKTKHSSRKTWAGDTNRHFTKEDTGVKETNEMFNTISH